MQPSFQIRTTETGTIEYDQCSLIIEAGEKHFSFALLLQETNEFIALEYYQFSAKNKDVELKDLLSSNTLLQLRYKDVRIYYNNQSGLLIPERFYDEETSDRMLELVAGELHSSLSFFDEVPEMKLRNIYSVPASLHQMCSAQFPQANFEHLHSGLLKKNAILLRKEDRMEVVFYPEQIVVLLWMKNNLQMLQSYQYESPEDISWYLLNICKQWNVDPSELPVTISGLVEKTSALFGGVDKYFSQTQTEERPEVFNYDIAFDKYPAHFFSPLFSLGLCVS